MEEFLGNWFSDSHGLLQGPKELIKPLRVSWPVWVKFFTRSLCIFQLKKLVWFKSVQWKPCFILKGKGIFSDRVSMQFGKYSVEKCPKNIIKCLWNVWKLIKHNLYFTEGRTQTSAHISTRMVLFWVKFGVKNLHEILMGICWFCDCLKIEAVVFLCV